MGTKVITIYGKQNSKLSETVPEYTECDHCGIFVGDYEKQMSKYMVRCSHPNDRLHKRDTVTNQNRCLKCNWMYRSRQEIICFECFKQVTEYDA